MAGGPLLCIGDLLSDVGEEDTTTTTDDIIRKCHRHSSVEDADLANQRIQPSDLTKLYQESYKCLNDALSGTSHSWTTLTLELCLALETTNKLIQSSDSHALEALEKIRELERITKKGNSVIKEAEFIHNAMKDHSGLNAHD
ncbi:uncharacterized protein LOC111921561 [Lactuca sativa]|uniref:Uncharacterized protein n=1 Tax=Lactuca sativa TaxID=4236 RepID=A0A9R1VWI5_LACSA|nr:uncharacterized protein LOC111921561 [Lactuca sativa]KAJ0212834.1 hypothetical protein LSAT_V11C400209950 [Lactuca sativa]